MTEGYYEGRRAMSGLKKIGIGFLILIGLVAIFRGYGRYREYYQLKELYRRRDDVAVLFHFSEYEQYAPMIRKDGHQSIPNSLLQLDKSGYSLQIAGELELNLGYFSETSEEIEVFFEIEIAGKNLQATYLLDKDFNLVESTYYPVDGNDEGEEIVVSESEETMLLHRVQDELNDFLSTMYKQLYEK